MKPIQKVLVGFALISSVIGNASTLWDEGVGGDLSNVASAPIAVTASLGVNSIIGVVGGADTRDFIVITIPNGLQLSSFTLAGYDSTDSQGFTGVQKGATFVGNLFSAGSYLGYAHFGKAATNGALPPTDLTGKDLLPLMGDTSLSTGSHGFTPPLGSGTYTFLIQQLGATTKYQFDVGVTAVPEPQSVCLGLIAISGALVLNRKFRSR
jgi:hypothetical protein